VPGPLGSMSLRLTIGTILVLVGLMLMAVSVVERWTPGEGWLQVTSFYGLVGAALAVVGGAMLVTPL
jgi:hypothetical protein